MNLLFGASNTGKSFSLKALDFMLGGSTPLPAIEQRVDYTSVWLGLTLPDGNPVTIYRAAAGGAYKVFDGLVHDAQDGRAGRTLQPAHDASRKDSLSQYLMGALGLDGRVVAKNMNGEKESLTLRSLVPYVLVQEGTIMSERSPVLASGQVIRETAEKNVFKTLLTGRDDSAVVATVNAKTQKTVRNAKVELVDEWMSKVDIQLGDPPPSREDVAQRLSRVDEELASLHSELRELQDSLDEQVARRRTLSDRADELTARLLELRVTVARFERLREIYDSDISRLDALEEGGFLILAIAGRDCPVCGAAPADQKHSHGLDDIASAHRSAKAEKRKIELERRDLVATMASLSAEGRGLEAARIENERNLAEAEAVLEALRPSEGGVRKRYEAMLLKRAELHGLTDLLDRRDELSARKAQLESVVKNKKGEKLVVGTDGNTAFALSATLQEVLGQWRFPGAEHVRFDNDLQDLTIAGKERAANGKGVRAILHAAFKVAVLVYCRRHGKSHPGFVVLDTPLLTYREPLAQPRYGELEPDEIALRQVGIVESFYRHLLSISDLGQFVVIENVTPPAFLNELANVETFTGRSGVGRTGFFPPHAETTALDLVA
ncbi:hypothetical protein [Aureimonas endophytica]|uniref:hypothetical protein n=1 Tax=Aureimonas endophytica TaxID=2027858 RepID=UPI0016687C90|nr:hypothetical protein [Aureimonas endophytica]